MSQAPPSITDTQPIFGPKLKDWLKRGWHYLYTYRPPLRERRFWVVQGFVVLIAVSHGIFEVPGALHDLGVPFFVPTTLFLVPVVYAALTFGFVGALATALWATLLTIPNWVFWHEGLERLACMLQMLIVIAMAFFTGQQVDRVRGARQRAETVRAVLRASEIKYRGLFESSPIAVLVLDANGTILNANPSAGVLFNRTPETLKNMAVAALVGSAGAQKLLGSSQNGGQPDYLTLKLKDNLEHNIEPTLTEADDGQGNFVRQVLFRDVTEERHRQAGLRAYATHVLRAQEEERQRIARELHDETIQQLVLLYRQLGILQGSSDSLPTPLVNMLREARGTTEEVVKALRDFTKTLRPPILDDLGLVASVRTLLSDFIQRTKIKGQIKTEGEQRRLASDTELGMFRIAQEALWNVERHAAATQVAVTITFAQHEASLEVQDNGIGFVVPPVPADFTATGQLGLISMQERSKLLNGKLEIYSTPGKGTRVRVSVPLAADAS